MRETILAQWKLFVLLFIVQRDLTFAPYSKEILTVWWIKDIDLPNLKH